MTKTLLKAVIPEPMRADQALLLALREGASTLSRTQVKALFREKRIRLGRRILSASDLLGAGTHELELEGLSSEAVTSTGARPSSRGSFIPIVYEDEDLLVLDKPSGIPSVPHSPAETDTAVSSALAHFPALEGVGRGGLEPGLLHRLDTGTSGLLVFAKHSAEFERLRTLWQSHAVRKTYRALVRPSASAATPPPPLTAPQEIRLDLAHDATSARRMVVLEPGRRIAHRGKPLPTLTKILEVEPQPQGVQAVTVEIVTGAMHQIRVTLAHLGYPILGDPVYRKAPAPRLFLHAWKLEFETKKGTQLKLESPLPF